MNTASLIVPSPRLYVGGIAELRPDKALVVCCINEHVDPPALVYPFEDSMFGMSVEDKRAALFLSDAAYSYLSAGEGNRPVVVVCRQGINRSALIAAMVLVRFGWNVDAAIDQVRKRRPGALENQSFVRWLVDVLPTRDYKDVLR